MNCLKCNVEHLKQDKVSSTRSNHGSHLGKDDVQGQQRLIKLWNVWWLGYSSINCIVLWYLSWVLAINILILFLSKKKCRWYIIILQRWWRHVWYTSPINGAIWVVLGVENQLAKVICAGLTWMLQKLVYVHHVTYVKLEPHQSFILFFLLVVISNQRRFSNWS